MEQDDQEKAVADLKRYLPYQVEPPITSRDLARMEDFLSLALFIFEILEEDKATARRRLLAFAGNAVERKVWEILIRQKASARGSRRGNRESINTKLKDKTILNAHADWQKGRAKPGSDRQFAKWFIEREAHKDATEAEIKRITKRLRDARQRSGTSIAPIATVDQSQYVLAGVGAPVAVAEIKRITKRLRDAR
jgi:hypothetical protein